MAVIRVFVCGDGNEVSWRFVCCSPICQTTRGIHTLLMSTGLTFGTISSLYGLNAGIINRQQFTILLGAVIGSAVIPTVVAQRWFAPPLQALKAEEIVEIEDEEFEPPRLQNAKTSPPGGDPR